MEKDKYTNKKGNRGRLPLLCFIVVSYVTGDLYDKGKRIANKLSSTFVLKLLYILVLKYVKSYFENLQEK